MAFPVPSLRINRSVNKFTLCRKKVDPTMKVILSTLNAKYIHTSLAIRCLKAYSEKDFDIELTEYTIKDP